MEPRPTVLAARSTDSGLSPAAWRPTTRVALLTGLAVAFALATLLIEASSGAPLEFTVLDGAVGLTFIVAGAVAWARRPEVLTGPLPCCAGHSTL